MHGHNPVPQRDRRVVNPTILVLLVCADVAFFALHSFNRLSSSRNDLFSLSVDGGYAEVFQYTKEYWITLALFTVWWRAREGVYAAWALLFTYLLLDDALTIHETAGRVVATYWTHVPAIGLRANDFGELTVSALAGLAFLGLIGWFYIRGSDRGRSVSRDLALLVGVLAFFGVGLDMVHGVLEALGVRALTIVEDGGEMLAMSIIASYVVILSSSTGTLPGSLWRSTVAALTSHHAHRDHR